MVVWIKFQSFPTNVLKWFVALKTEKGYHWRLLAIWQLLTICTCNMQLNTLCTVFTISTLSTQTCKGCHRLDTDVKLLCVQWNWSLFKIWGHAEENKWKHSFHSDGLLCSSTLDIPGSRVTYLWVRVEVDDYGKVEKWHVISNYKNRIDSTKDKVSFKKELSCVM